MKRILEIRRHTELVGTLGIDPSAMRGRAKYQDGRTSPSLWHLADLLRRFGWREERFQLLASVFFNALIGNADAHAKNYSLFVSDPVSVFQGTVRLSPLYDTVPTLLWPELRDRNALRVGDQERVSETTSKDLVVEAVRWGLPPALAMEAIVELVAAARNSLSEIEHDALRSLIEARLDTFRTS